jgi:SPP1 family predicted phage head-tail adaptor
MITHIGRFDTRVTLQTPTETVDDQGSTTQTWATTATVWAKIETISATETTNGNERTPVQEYRFTVRYQSTLATFSAGCRIQRDGINYDILSALPMPEGRPDTIQITARRKA